MSAGNAGNGLSDVIGVGASINDTAFPIVEKNITSKVNSTSYKYTSNSTSYSSFDSGISNSNSYSGGDSGSGSGSSSN